MSCAAFPATRVINKVEELTGVPVVTSNQAMIWMAYRTMGINDKIDLGKLFDYELL